MPSLKLTPTSEELAAIDNASLDIIAIYRKYNLPLEHAVTANIQATGIYETEINATGMCKVDASSFNGSGKKAYLVVGNLAEIRKRFDLPRPTPRVDMGSLQGGESYIGSSLSKSA